MDGTEQAVKGPKQAGRSWAWPETCDARVSVAMKIGSIGILTEGVFASHPSRVSTS